MSNAQGTFGYTALTSIDNLFLRQDGDTKNTKLNKVARMFYGCSDITSNLPAMNDPNVYSRIDLADKDTGYGGYCYGCSNAQNISSFSGG